MNIHFIKTPEKRDIVEELGSQFGITQLPFLLIESGKEKIRAFSGSLSKDEIHKIGEVANIELIGMYLLKREGEFRLSLDASNALKDQITKNIIELNEQQMHDWIRGNDIEMEKESGVYVIKFKEDFLGCTKSNGHILFNYVPKDRRIKK